VHLHSLLLLFACLCFSVEPPALPQELRPGIVACVGPDLPLPVTGYDVYLFGEMHGIRETKPLFQAYLARLHREAGLRDVFLEEDQVYEQAARDYVEGKTDRVPSVLCLRADVLLVVRQFNKQLPLNQRVAVHLVDLDSPMSAIRQHLLQVETRLARNDEVHIPDESELAQNGLELVDRLLSRAVEPRLRGELQTVRNSLVAYREGFEAESGPTKGNVLMEAREEAIARNVLSVLKGSQRRVALGFYGSIHGRKKAEKLDLGTGPFLYRSLASRLGETGVKVLSVYCWALSGSNFWRGTRNNIPSMVGSRVRVNETESLQQVMSEAPDANMFLVDLSKQPAFHDDVGGLYDFGIWLRVGSPMENACAP